MKAIDHIGSAFLRRILRRMKQLGVNQSELAQRMKVSKPYITKVLHQDVNFSFRTATKLAQALEMDFFPELREKVGSENDGMAASSDWEPKGKAGSDDGGGKYRQCPPTVGRFAKQSRRSADRNGHNLVMEISNI